MAEDCGLSTLAATEAVSRSRSGSSSGSSESDVSPICKISPLVPVSSNPPRPLTPKKRHRMEMEQEARRQEVIKAAERAKAECEAMTLTDEREVEQEVSLERISELKAEIPAEPESASPIKPAGKAKDTKTETIPIATDEKRTSVKKRKAEEDNPQPEPITPGKRRRSIPKKFADHQSPASAKPAKKTPKAPRTPPAVTDAGERPPVPEGWRRVLTQRMQGTSAGKFDVYIWSPSGKKFRSRPQLMAYLEETGSSLTIDDFSFKHKGSSVTPARVKRGTPLKKERSSPKKKAKEINIIPKRGRPRKYSEGKSPTKAARKSPSKPAGKSPSKPAGKAKGKQQRKVMKPPPDTGSKKASRAQQLQKLLVKINFQKPGDKREMPYESSEESDDDFDPGTTEEAGPDVSDISLTPSPPSSQNVRRHSSPAV